MGRTLNLFQSMMGFLIYNGPVLPARPTSLTQFDLTMTYSCANLLMAYLALLRFCLWLKLYYAQLTLFRI